MEQLDKIKQWSRALDGSDYLPGMVSGSFQLKVYFSAFQWENSVVMNMQSLQM